MTNPRDQVNLDGMNSQEPVLLLTDATITYSATVKNGHALAGFGAVRWVGNKQVGLAAADENVDGQLVSVEPDGKAVCKMGGFVTFKEGATAGATVGNQVVGDTVDGYVKNLAVAAAANHGKVVSVDLPASGDVIYLL